MPWQDVRPSVCLSHAGILCLNGYTYRFYPQFFHHRVAPPFYFAVTFSSSIILWATCKRSNSSTCAFIVVVFLHQTGWQYSYGDRPNGGIECMGV